MSYASLAAPAFAVRPRLSPCLSSRARRAARGTVSLLHAAGQVLAFAGVLWLLLAGPGLVSDRDSTVPNRHGPAFARR